MTRTEPIGSDFGYPDAGVRQDTARDLSSFGQLVRSGRQGLSMAARALSERRSVWLPDFHCDSMVEPFVAQGFALHFYRLDEDLWPVLDDVALLADAVVVVAPYFGRSVPTGLPEALTVLADRESTPLVLDETHTVFDAPLPANIRVASLRKLLPLGEGGSVSGLDDLDRLPLTRSSGYRAREEAARLRATPTVSFEASRELFLAAEVELTTHLEPQAADPRMAELLRTLDVEELARRRRANAVVLADGLSRADLGSSVAPLRGYRNEATPAYLTCTTARPRELQAALAQRRIYCPVHWPASVYGSGRPWRSDLISFPIDHRYGPEDMERIVDEVSRHFRS